MPHPTSFAPPGSTQYLLYRRLVGPQNQMGNIQNILPPQGFIPEAARPTVIHYTDYNIPDAYLTTDLCITPTMELCTGTELNLLSLMY